ncbi:MAG: T9SS type A sorting domain-containing protein [Bacteroidetes bacterium]|nr:T9SS type A sorting domain-containing protein [Bacteroidota bacterium]
MNKIYSKIAILLVIVSIIIINNNLKAQSGLNATFNSTANSYIDFGRGQNLGCITDLPNGNKMTITMWIKWGSKTAAGVSSWSNMFTLADSSGNGDNGVFWLQHNSANSLFEFALQTQNGRSFIYSTTNPSEGTWYHIACVYDGSLANNNMKLYVNGVQESSCNKSGNIAAFSNVSKLNMGRWANSNGNYRRFNGIIDEVSIWKTALTSAEINTLKNNPNTVLGQSYNATGLIGYWNFDNGTANDLCACHNNGIIGTTVVLPIELVGFNAKVNENQVDISWITASEINNNYFTIERSANGKEFEKIGTVNGSGNSNNILEYSFTDNNPIQGISYYRLRQTDFDGKTTVSDLKSVNIDNENNQIVKVYPNPSNGNNVQISIKNDTDQISFLQIYDYSGKIILSSKIQGNTFIIPNNTLKTGLYSVKLATPTSILSSIISVVN